jgi:hypothetical protein
MPKFSLNAGLTCSKNPSGPAMQAMPPEFRKTVTILCEYFKLGLVYMYSSKSGTSA